MGIEDAKKKVIYMAPYFYHVLPGIKNEVLCQIGFHDPCGVGLHAIRPVWIRFHFSKSPSNKAGKLFLKTS